MEKHKDRAVANLVKRSNKRLCEFIAAVEEIKEQLQETYEDLDDKWRHGTSFVEMMLKDGCFLLGMGMTTLTILDQARWDDCRELWTRRPYLQQAWLPILSIRSDVVLMENQLPLLLLQKLADIAYPTNIFEELGLPINNWVVAILCPQVSNITPVDVNFLGLHHPLDVFQKSTRGIRQHRQRPCRIQSAFVMPCAAELHEAGVHLKLSDAHGLAGGVTFKGGELNIPKIKLYDNAERIFLNLMAFERLHPGVGNGVMAFVVFLDLLIGTPKDVALLRSKGIIDSGLGSDEMVADLFNKILTKVAIMSLDSSLFDVMHEVNAHCKKPWNKWRTVYTIVPFYKNK
uniref:Uncharacterized protein n=1 Tax=Leersia perrieri TaxID=77586 RepID=A0A0D9XSS0_9ORYZ